MNKIYKYLINIQDDVQVIPLPAEAQILSFQLQDNQPCLWVLLNTQDLEIVDRKFIIKGTGYPIFELLENLNYIGTIQQGMFVWHLFELV